MAAPTVTARVLPTGYKLPDGFKTTIAFSRYPSVQFWEETVQMAGIDGGEPIPQTTMLNIAWRTMRPRSLKTLTNTEISVAYDPDVIATILVMINLEDSITIHLPENSTWCYYGYLQKFEPEAFEEGKMPKAKISVIATNYDYTNQVEAAPVFTPASGT